MIQCLLGAVMGALAAVIAWTAYTPENADMKILSQARAALTPNHPSKMWGRVFDLSKKVKVDLDGFSLYAMPNDYVAAPIIRDKIYEPHITALIRRELKPAQTFMDLGANIGYYTMLASSIVGPKGKVIAYEPHPQNLQLIYESQLANGFHNQMIYPYAVSDKAGILRFTTVGSNGGVVTESSKDQRYYMLVPAVTIDEFMPDQRIDLVKIDIEAHEPYAIRGMEKLITKHKPKIITEFHPYAMRENGVEPSEYLKQLETIGYRLGVISESGVEPMAGKEIMTYWQNLNKPTVHLDLYGVVK